MISARSLKLAVVSLVAAVRLTAQAPSGVAAFIPPHPDPAHVFVLDSAHILSATTIAALQDSARALQAETNADVAWVTLPTLGGRAVEEAALYIGRTWQIGTPGNPGDPLRNRGLVILYVPDKTTTAGPNFRIEVGKGLEGTITDSRSRSITNAMRADLKAKTYDDAYMAGWAAAAALVREDFAARGVAASPVPAGSSSPAIASDEPNHNTVLLVWTCLGAALLIAISIIVSIRRSRAGVRTRAVGYSSGDDVPRRRRAAPFVSTPAPGPVDDSRSSGSSGGSDSGSSSGGGDFGGGGGFDGGGSSDSI